MPMRILCEVLGLPNIGETKKKNAQTVALNTLLDSFRNTEVRSPSARRFPIFCSLTSGISHTILLEGCWLEITRAALLRLILLSWRTPSQGNTSIMWVRLLRNALLLIVTRGASLVALTPHFFCSSPRSNRAHMIQSFLLLALTWLP